ncbi:hypothetical protein UFOVP131_27 [uncultured Caudovirales phage]|uniref:Holin n=1 Tax=uncultured Caudovirales phage TaxID=2100421 RepID=A0A6J5LEZ0_9CAUD|nr:hypothetical protein UFOVP131_27 [uncultured Caudovirales phage]
MIEQALLSYGVPGLIILILLGAIGKLDKRNEAIQEKRIAESREAIKALEQNTNALESLTDIVRERKNG